MQRRANTAQPPQTVILSHAQTVTRICLWAPSAPVGSWWGNLCFVAWLLSLWVFKGSCPFPFLDSGSTKVFCLTYEEDLHLFIYQKEKLMIESLPRHVALFIKRILDYLWQGSWSKKQTTSCVISLWKGTAHDPVTIHPAVKLHGIHHGFSWQTNADEHNPNSPPPWHWPIRLECVNSLLWWSH